MDCPIGLWNAWMMTAPTDSAVSSDVILVTGDLGYIGSVLVGRLRARGHDVATCDARWFASTVDGGRSFQSLSVADLVGVTAIVHLAGPSSHQTVDAFPGLSNPADVATFAERARQAGVDRFVFASSAAVYNGGEAASIESSPTSPASGYSSAKLDAERLLVDVAADGFDVVVCRLASCFGWSPGLRPELLINRMCALAVDGQPLRLSSNGGSWRPFVHVEDAANAFIHAATMTTDSSFSIFNVVGSDGNLTVAEAAARVARVAGSHGLEVSVPQPDPADDPRSYSLDGTAFSDAGFVPRWSIDDGISDLLLRLRIERGEASATELGVSRVDRLRQLAGVGHFDCSATEHLSLPGSVSPFSLPPGELADTTAALHTMLATSRYRLGGGHATVAEQLLADELELPHSWGVLGMRSGTDSLVRALWLAGVRPGSRVAVPDVAFHAVAATVCLAGAEPVVIDITADTWNLCPASLETAAASGSLDAVIVVDNYGTPADLTGLSRVCRSHDLPLILDACESLGATRPDPMIADLVDYVAMSFSFTKPIHAAGMGGALCARTDELDRAESTPLLLVRQTRLPEINAAYLVDAWRHLHSNIARLNEIYRRYVDLVVPHGFVPQVVEGVSTRIHAPFLVPEGLDRDELLARLADAGVAATGQFPSQSRLLELGPVPAVAADVDQRVVSLPTGSGLTDHALAAILDRLGDVLSSPD